MFNGSALLLDDALLECVVTEVVGSFGDSIITKYKCSPDSDSEISLKIGQYSTKLRQTKQHVPFFWATLYLLTFKNESHPVRLQLPVLILSSHSTHNSFANYTAALSN